MIVNDLKYRQNVLADLKNSPRPVFVQMAANDVKLFMEATRIVKDFCDAVDLNLGCPQHIARRGGYGAFMMLGRNQSDC